MKLCFTNSIEYYRYNDINSQNLFIFEMNNKNKWRKQQLQLKLNHPQILKVVTAATIHIGQVSIDFSKSLIIDRELMEIALIVFFKQVVQTTSMLFYNSGKQYNM